MRLADGGTTALLGVGDVVDVIAASPGPSGDQASARVVASGVRVLALPDGAGAGSGLLGGGEAQSGLLVLAATRSEALALARAEVAARLSVVLTGPGLRSGP